MVSFTHLSITENGYLFTYIVPAQLFMKKKYDRKLLSTAVSTR